MPDRRPGRHRPARFVSLGPVIVGLVLALSFAAGTARGDGRSPAGAAVDGIVLVAYLETYVKDRDLTAFRERVEARFREPSLLAILGDGDAEARRAAVTALGLVGSFRANDRVGRALKDRDPVVRAMASNALWSIWFRADTPENNARLQEVMDLSRRDRLREADAAATRLIERAPTFAEAHNQRAIVRFTQGRYAESIADCRQAIELNPYHFGAISGLGQCHLRMGQAREALEAFRLGLKIQPYNDALRQTIEALEAER